MAMSMPRRYVEGWDGLQGPVKVCHSIRQNVDTQLEPAEVGQGVAVDILGHGKQTMTLWLYSAGSS